ncbi:MAG: glycosyltransferase family 4 protein [Candidatus Kapaibacteriota bacterium]
MARVIYLFKGKFPWDGRLVKICTSLQKAGNEVLVVARAKNNQNRTRQWNNLKIWYACASIPTILSTPYPNNPFWISDLKKIFSEFNPDLIIVRDFFLVKATRKALASNSIPIVIDMAEHYPSAMREWEKYKRNPVAKFLINNLKLIDKWEAECVGNSDAIITVCDEQKERLVAQYSYPENKIEIVYNTPELNQFARIERRQKSSPRVFIHHGFHTSEKPIDKFLEYFIDCALEEKGFKFIIAGAGDCIPRLKKIVEQKEAKNVIFTGYYDFEQLPYILQNADIGVIPYPPNDFNNHTLHNKVFDYLAAGIPILVSEAKPLKRLVFETNAGVSIPIERENLCQFFATIDKYNWNEMSQNAIKHSRKKYNWEVDEKKLIRFLETVLYG